MKNYRNDTLLSLRQFSHHIVSHRIIKDGVCVCVQHWGGGVVCGFHHLPPAVFIHAFRKEKWAEQIRGHAQPFAAVSKQALRHNGGAEP